MSVKAALKAAKSSLDAGVYEATIREAQKALKEDHENYFASLFLGRAYEKQGRLDDAAKTYDSAAKSKPNDTQAWLGLCSLYEAQGSAKVDEYRDAATRVAQIYTDADDREKCQTTLDKLIAFSKRNGSRTQYKHALEILLPGKGFYEYLEGRLQNPELTYTRITEITEEEEASKIKQEIATRRTRIGAKVGQVTTDVKREVFGQSHLEELYQQVINWSSNDETRRQYEEKLLERAYDVLVALPTEQKVSKLDQVLTLAEGMVIIHHPFRLAWDLVLESRDLGDLRDLDANILQEYTTFFTSSGLAQILKSWLMSELSPFPPPKEDTESTDGTTKQISPEDRLLMMTEGLSAEEESPFAHRLVADYYLHLEEHGTAVDTARAGIKALALKSSKLGMSLQNTKDAINSVLATALVHYQAPRNHPESRRLFEDILQRRPKWTSALVGLGLIFEENEQYGQAIEFLSRANSEDSSNIQVGTELAWCRALNGDYAGAKEELEAYLSHMQDDDPRARDLRAQVLYRIGVCIWELDPSKAARKDRHGAYARFLAAIKTNVSFAPAYTNLGHYYNDYSRDKKRARQCFQKAFELSTAETDAAARLAESFADQGDWDIVEVIAQRVIDSGRARPPPGSKRKGLSWPYSALGVVLMNKQEYQLAITSFLAALRISPDDYQSYVGLGESYHNSGRYNSALRTFEYALKPHDEGRMRVTGETWFARYMLANVHRELGDFDDAINGLEEVLQEHKNEFGVLLSLLQTFIEKAWMSLEVGLYGQAVNSACRAISTATLIAKDHPNAFNMWKSVGDACIVFSWVQADLKLFPAQEVKELLSFKVESAMYEPLVDTDQIRLDDVNNTGHTSPENDVRKAFQMGILAYKRAIHSCSNDMDAQAVAWYNLGWAEHRAYTCESSLKSAKKYLRAGVRCFKRAIELEAGNAEFWNALGVVTTTLNPKVAQHSFVRSLHLNELNAKVWTNLGALYLLQKDYELAHQAFSRAQSTDPEYAHAWVGEGLIATLIGNSTEALSHFTHAFEISGSRSTVVKSQYVLSAFDHLTVTPTRSNDLTSLIQPIFALEQLHRQNPDLLSLEHLAALYSERVADHAAATCSLTSLCAAVDAEYEALESSAALARFSQAKADLARNYLATREFELAAENAEIALDLSSDKETCGLDAPSRTKLRLSAHLTAGLALYNSQRSTDCIAMFREALTESDGNPDVVATLVRVLWTQGGEEERGVAREQLFECMEKHPAHIPCVTLLGALAALDGDTETMAAVQDDLISLRTSVNLSAADETAIANLLSAFAALNETSEGADAASLAEAQAAILLQPEHPHAWRELAALTGDLHASQMALRTAQKAVPPLGGMDAGTLARAFEGTGTVADAQRAIYLAPGKQSSWEALRGAIEKE